MKILSLLLLSFISKLVLSQDMLTLINDNHAGVSSLTINPSYIADSKLWLDVNILSLDLYSENNYIFIPGERYSFSNLISNNEALKDSEGTILYDNYPLKNTWKFYLKSYIQLPSVMVNIGENGFAFFNNYRVHANMSNVEFHLAKFIKSGLDYRPQQGINYFEDKTNLAEASWLETGFSYARKWKGFGRSIWSAGITVKKTTGINSFFMKAANSDYIVLNDSTFQVYNSEMEIGYSPLSPSRDKAINLSNSLFNGSGWGFDAGITLQIKSDSRALTNFKRPCSQHYEPYILKAGFSLLDFGYIRYKNAAARYASQATSIYWENIDNYKFDGFDVFSNDLNYHAAPNLSYISSGYSISLPAAVSLQADYNFGDGWFMNSTLIKRVPLGYIRLKRPDTFSITPRFESKFLGVALPVVLYDWSRPRIGFGIRLFNFTIGTDYLNTFLGLSDFYGMDVYFSLKISFEKGYCRLRLSDFFRGKRFYNRACYDN